MFKRKPLYQKKSISNTMRIRYFWKFVNSNYEIKDLFLNYYNAKY